MDYYRTSLQHLLAELERIDLLIQKQVAFFRRSCDIDSFRGLCISEEEIDELLQKPIGIPRWVVPVPITEQESIRARLDELAEIVQEKRNASLKQGIDLRLVRLKNEFELSSIDIDIILICIVSELDLCYERIYAYLQDDITKKRPTVDLVLSLLSTCSEERLSVQKHLEEYAPLVRNRLIGIIDQHQDQPQSFLGRFLHLDRRVAHYLLESDEIDSRLHPFAKIVSGTSLVEQAYYSSSAGLDIHQLSNLFCCSEHPVCIYLHGRYGSGRRYIGGGIAKEVAHNILLIDCELLTHSTETSFEDAVKLCIRESKLTNSVLFFERFDSFLHDDRRQLLSSILRLLNAQDKSVILSGETRWVPSSRDLHHRFLEISVPTMEFNQRSETWRCALSTTSHDLSDEVIDEIASAFKLTGGQIRDAMKSAISTSWYRAPENPVLTVDDLTTACRLHSTGKLGKMAKRVHTSFYWGDIVLPGDRIKQLHDFCSWIKHRGTVHDRWGFAEKLSLGRGISALFVGPSGTGKTMAASILANEIGLDLYKIDLSSVVSKYIGETEKNLAKIFDEAETSNAILFFDEADALFGKRTDVRDSHDRYANIEISYLLQRLEEYDGVGILATNLAKNLDAAFVRRLSFVVYFPFPDTDSRKMIWEKVWPSDAPRKDPIDLDFLAKKFELAGGNIRNIALASAFMAAEESDEIDMGKIVRATHRECMKIGKLMGKSDFEPYGELLWQI